MMTFQKRKRYKRRHKAAAYLSGEKRILHAVAGMLLKSNIPLELEIGVSGAVLKPRNARDQPRFRLAIETLNEQYPNAFDQRLFED